MVKMNGKGGNQFSKCGYVDILNQGRYGKQIKNILLPLIAFSRKLTLKHIQIYIGKS